MIFKNGRQIFSAPNFANPKFACTKRKGAGNRWGQLVREEVYGKQTGHTFTKLKLETVCCSNLRWETGNAGCNNTNNGMHGEARSKATVQQKGDSDTCDGRMQR